MKISRAKRGEGVLAKAGGGWAMTKQNRGAQGEGGTGKAQLRVVVKRRGGRGTTMKEE